jgi:hypothetical protein
MTGNSGSSTPGGPGRSRPSRRAKWGIAAVVLLIIVVVSGGHDSKKPGRAAASGTQVPAAPAAVASAPVAHTARSRSTHNHARHKAARKAHHTIGSRSSVCPSATEVLAGVYHSDRLRLISPCRHVTGTVISTRSEEDGDLHFDVRLDSPYRSMLVANNYSEQDGALVVEFMPRDHGHLPAPSVGDRVSITGAYVDDMDHAWSEIHPVWALAIDHGRLYRSGPQYGGSPDSARSYDATRTCHTNAGAPCTSYGGTTASSSPEPTTTTRSTPAPPSSSGASGADCTPGYSPCIPPGPDVDCAGGSGNGPRYVQGPVQVTGSDRYHLDANGDGVGCE